MKSDLGFVALVEASELTEIVVLTAGKVEFSHGGPLAMTTRAAEKIIAAFKAQGVQLPIDYEHATIVKGEKAEKAPAAGWITAMHWEPDRGLVASVEWTSEAREYIETTGYKYLSPVLHINTETREPYKLHSMALTNKPATKRQKELLAASANLLEEILPMATKTAEASGKETKDVKKKGVIIAQEGGEGEAAGGNHIMKIAVALTKAGFEVDASNEDAVMQAVLAFIESKTGETGEPEGAPGEEVAASEILSALQAKDGTEAVIALKANFVPRADYKLLSERFTALEARDKGREVDAVLAQMIDKNKINPNDEEQMKACRDYAEKDLAAFTAFMAAQPPYMEPGRTVAPMSGKVSTADDRRGLITQACAEYNGAGRAFQRLTTLPAFVTQELAEQDMTALSEEETKILN